MPRQRARRLGLRSCGHHGPCLRRCTKCHRLRGRQSAIQRAHPCDQGPRWDAVAAYRMQAPALPSLVTVMAAPLVVLSTACVDQPMQSQCTALGCACNGTGCAVFPFGTSRRRLSASQR